MVFGVKAFGFLPRLPRDVFDNLTEPLTRRKGHTRHQHCADGGGVDGRLQAALLHEPARPPPGQDRQARQPERPQGAAAVQVIQVVSAVQMAFSGPEDPFYDGEESQETLSRKVA